MRARQLRNEASPAERLLWTALSNRKVDGWKFSRQIPVGPYFADFLCRSAKLVIEIDGWTHDARQAADARRDRFMADHGFTVLRFSNDDVLHNLEGVVQAISATLCRIASPPTPPASGRGAIDDGAAPPSRLREGPQAGLPSFNQG